MACWVYSTTVCPVCCPFNIAVHILPRQSSNYTMPAEPAHIIDHDSARRASPVKLAMRSKAGLIPTCSPASAHPLSYSCCVERNRGLMRTCQYQRLQLLCVQLQLRLLLLLACSDLGPWCGTGPGHIHVGDGFSCRPGLQPLPTLFISAAPHRQCRLHTAAHSAPRHKAHFRWSTDGRMHCLCRHSTWQHVGMLVKCERGVCLEGCLACLTEKDLPPGLGTCVHLIAASAASGWQSPPPSCPW